MPSPVKRQPTLVEIHGYGLNWDLCEEETERFTSWLSQQINHERSSQAVQSAEALRKVQSTVQNALVHAAVRAELGTDLTYAWFLKHQHFDKIFTAYAKYCSEERGNASTFVAKQLSELKHAVEWASIQQWEWGQCKHETSTSILSKLSTLQLQYSAHGTVENKRKREASTFAVAHDIGSVTLEEYSTHVDQLESAIHAKFDLYDDPSKICEAPDEDKLLVAECLLLKLVYRGGRGIDLHQVLFLSREQYGTAESWIADVDFKGTFLVGGSDWPNYSDEWELFVLSSKGHFIEHPLEGVDRLLDLYMECFPNITYGEDYLFTPSMHGVRSTQSAEKEFFADSAKFGDYVAIVTTREFGVTLRPYDIRRLVSTNLTRGGATPEVTQSHAALMGTSSANLTGMCVVHDQCCT